MAHAGSTGAGYEVEFRVCWPDGTTHWLSSRDRMERDANHQPVRLHGIGTDIGDRKSLEAQFRQAQKMEAVGQLAGGVAHDFNNLLTVILGFSDFVLDSFGSEDPRRADMEEIVKAGQRAAALTQQLLAFSRKQVLQPTVLDLNASSTDMRHMLAPPDRRRHRSRAGAGADLAPVRADPGQLEQVIMNLVVNARDAMPDGGRLTMETANVELDAAVSRGACGRCAGRVRDAGGQRHRHRHGRRDAGARSFEPFFTTKEIGKGTGLGLATVYGIVKQSGGHIWVYSEPGQGTTFKVYLPRAAGAPVTERRLPRAATAVASTETVLVVEDEAAVRLLTCRILQQAGYRVLMRPMPCTRRGIRHSTTTASSCW